MSGTPLYNPNDNVTGRDGGPYLDEVEARNAEVRRAVVEQREPDLENPPATAGMPLLPGGRMLGIIGVNNLPSQSGRMDLSDASLIQYRADDENEPNFSARGEIPEDFESDVETELANDEATDETSDDSLNFDEGVNSHDPNFGGLDNSASDEEGEGDPEDPEVLNFDPSASFTHEQE